MTEGTRKEGLQVAQLDRTKAPPGHTGCHSPGWNSDCLWCRLAIPGVASAADIAEGWEHYAATRPPPGMNVFHDGLEWFWRVAGSNIGRRYERASKAYAAAWAYYWRRAELVRRMKAITDPRFRLQAPVACRAGRERPRRGGGQGRRQATRSGAGAQQA